jgi:LPXTG-motif cell wall-anchored protein
MKKTFLAFAMASLLIIGFNKAVAQDQPKPKKDTVNMDTDAKPQFYYPVEDDKAAEKGKEKSGLPIAAIVAGAVAIVGVAGFFLLKKKK